MTLILGLETTCDETAAAVVRDGKEVLSNPVFSQIHLHQKYGGVVPEIAARAHLEGINEVVKKALDQAGVRGEDLDGIAVAHAPGLVGCLLVGVSAAKGYAFAWQKPLLAVNHVQAHLYAVGLGEGADFVPPAIDFPALGLVISGGHSALYRMDAFDQLQRIGTTHDDAVGEAFDKVAAILKLGYPGGPLIDRLSQEGDPMAIRFPVSLLEKDSLDFSFSGIKTAVLYEVNGHKGRERDASALSQQQKANVAASFQWAATKMLVEKCRRGAERIGARSLIVGGGVSANRAIRTGLATLGRQLGIPVFVPPMSYCTDNGAMIAGLGYQHLRAGRVAGLDLEVVATM